jgi:chaperonin cofactor prefoldin
MSIEDRLDYLERLMEDIESEFDALKERLTEVNYGES